MKTLNLDQLAAQHAQQMVNDGKSMEGLERLITKTLGVLQAQGVYAMMLFLLSRTGEEKNIAPAIYKECNLLIMELPEFSGITVHDNFKEDKKILQFYSNDKVQNIDTLILIRDLFEQTLIYARYGAKAAKDK